MKVVIIGGGIAGLTLGGFLLKKDFDVVINERADGMPVKGHAFLMHTDGLAVLQELQGQLQAAPIGKRIDSFRLKRPDGAEIKHLKLDSWLCIKRVELISYLYSLVPANRIKEGREFSHFLFDGEKAVAAVFANGDVEYGDIFVGADGGNSRVREKIFGKVKFTPVEVKEIVGVAKNSSVSTDERSIFTKIQSNETGLAFGYIPATDSEFVWFMQYDPTISDVTNNTPEGLKSFCQKLLRKFPQEVHDVIEANNFESTYTWNTRDFELLPSFHKGNVVLMGDAAHLALPFTSAGTTNAIMDAQVLSALLGLYENPQVAFRNYYEQRATDLENHVKLGRDLKKIFLDPTEQEDDEIPVPLISHNLEDKAEARNKQIQIIYFTDPICSTCWVMQPSLRKLEIEYGRYLNIEYHMGGMLPSWETYTKGKIKEPLDAARHWEEVAVSHKMPLDGDVWIEDPLHSSYPPSIAFKAAQIQHNLKARSFLRKMQEMVFIEKKNIIKWDYIAQAALETGLDAARLLKDFDLRASDLFDDDLKLARKLSITTFPTLLFTTGGEIRATLRGFQPYEKFEEIILRLIPDARKDNINTDPNHLFSLFPTLTTKEFAQLTNRSMDEALEVLQELYLNLKIGRYDSKNGIIWKRKPRTLH